MNISTSFQPVGSVALHGKLPRLLPPFLAVWCGQTERKTSFADDELFVALFRVLVDQLAKIGEAFGIIGQPVFEISVVGMYLNDGACLVKVDFGGFSLFFSPVFIKAPFRVHVTQ